MVHCLYTITSDLPNTSEDVLLQVTCFRETDSSFNPSGKQNRSPGRPANHQGHGASPNRGGPDNHGQNKPESFYPSSEPWNFWAGLGRSPGYGVISAYVRYDRP